MVLLALVQAALAQGVNNPGGDRIPYVKLQSDSWDVVIRMTGPGRARLERVKARCGEMWVNGCAPGIDPQLRQIALSGVFGSEVQLSGDFSYCSTAVVRNIPANMARNFVKPSTGEFCRPFLDPDAVRNLRRGDATRGENRLVDRLMGGQGTTSGTVRIKAPPTLDGSGGEERVATGERRTEEQTRANQRVKAPQPVRPEPVAAAPVETYIQEDTPTAVAPRPAPAVDLLAEDPPSVDLLAEDPPEPVYDASFDPLALEPGEADLGPPPADVDAELAALLAPLPGLPPEDQVVVPPPVRTPTRKLSESERRELENVELDAITSDDEEDRKRKKKDRDEPEVEVGTDDDLGDFIIIDIEGLPD